MTTGPHMKTFARSRTGPGRLALAGALLTAAIVGAQQPPQQPVPAPQQPSEIVTRIDSGSGAPPHYAVPDFIALSPNVSSTAQMIAQVLWDDLAFEREFDMMPRDINKNVAVARTPDQIPFGTWRENGADGVFFGTVEQKGSDILVEVR